jgi:hypothetical protein
MIVSVDHETLWDLDDWFAIVGNRRAWYHGRSGLRSIHVYTMFLQFGFVWKNGSPTPKCLVILFPVNICHWVLRPLVCHFILVVIYLI